MIQPANQNYNMITVTSRAVKESLNPEELYFVYLDLMEKMQTPDPDNPNLWSTTLKKQTIWGILDEEAGPNGEDVFSILYPSDY